MKFSIPTNWQSDLLSHFKNTEVKELYGKLASDFIGGGKHSFQVPFVFKKQAEKHIKDIHVAGLEFNYLLNATCLNNLEWTIRGQRKIRAILDWLMDLKVEGVTVAIPYLVKFIKKNYPKIRVYLSTLSGTDMYARVKYWHDLGVDRITLLNVDINRNFPLLRRITREISCEFNLVANVNCLYHCPFYLYHGLQASHSSQSGHRMRGFVIDYCRISCRYRQIANVREFIRSSWIRPEDVKIYEDIGIDYLKIIDRGMTTFWISRITGAYLNRRYDGNLMDLFPDPSKTMVFNGLNLWHKFKYFFHPGFVDVFKLIKMRKLLIEPNIFIDNRALDGFISFFLDHDCEATTCEECGYCGRVAGQVVKIDVIERKEVMERYEKCLSGIISGELFRC